MDHGPSSIFRLGLLGTSLLSRPTIRGLRKYRMVGRGSGWFELPRKCIRSRETAVHIRRASTLRPFHSDLCMTDFPNRQTF